MAQEKPEMSHIISKFFLKDNIDINQFFENEKAFEIVRYHFGVLKPIFLEKEDRPEEKLSKLKISSTFESHFLGGYIINKFHSDAYSYSFMMIAYPDVTVWLMNNREIVNEILLKYNVPINGREKSKLIDTFKINPLFESYLINSIKKTNGLPMLSMTKISSDKLLREAINQYKINNKLECGLL